MRTGCFLLRSTRQAAHQQHSLSALSQHTLLQAALGMLPLLPSTPLVVSDSALYVHIHVSIPSPPQGTDVPFAHTLAPYPVHRQQPLPPTFADQKDPPPSHIPPFLPAFPDPHTYQHTAAYSGHQTDPHKQRQVGLVACSRRRVGVSKGIASLDFRQRGVWGVAGLDAAAALFRQTQTWMWCGQRVGASALP